MVDGYAKCGEMGLARQVFDLMSERDVVSWSSLIDGYVKAKRYQTACARSGLVKEALNFFECLQKHGMAAKSEHYACMVDMLARSGQVAEAYELVSRMPMEPTASMLGALFNGCISYKRLDLAEIVGRKLIEIQPDNDGRYVGLSNVYAEVRRWDECRNTRAEMERKGVKKTAGYSLVL
ncbi:Pentatricopeptide repeat-containing protein At5g08305 [Linum grandiflorum]